MPNVLSCAVLRYYDAACDKFGALCKCDYNFMELEAQEWGVLMTSLMQLLKF